MASLARAGRLLSRTGALATGAGPASASKIAEHPAMLPGALQHIRGMASGRAYAQAVCLCGMPLSSFSHAYSSNAKDEGALSAA